MINTISEVSGANPSRVRGTVAMRIVGELTTRLAAGDLWEFAAFGRNDEIIVSGTSGQDSPDIGLLRAELRLQRFAGTILPHVAPSLNSDQRCSLYVFFGELAERVAILRIVRMSAGKPYTARDGAGIERFFRQHGDAIAAAVFERRRDDGEGFATGRAAPLAFTIDRMGNLLSTVDEPDCDMSSLRGNLLPRNGELPLVLRPIISDLLERYRAGADAAELVAILPFALVRLTQLRARGAIMLLVTVEWLRSQASLEVTAAQYSISKRELQVLGGMLRGAAVSQIALELSISESTVVFHLKRMLKKTLSKNRTELAARMLGYQTSAVS